jgi:hypothetical protein
MTHVFHRGELFWTEASILAQAIVSRWMLNQNAQAQYINGVDLPGKVCGNVRLENGGRHLHMVQCGQFNEDCSFTEVAPSGGRFASPSLLDDIFLIRLEQIVFGHAFEEAKVLARRKWGAYRNWPLLLQVGYHLRNGAFHGNSFFFKDDRIMGSPSWRSLNITLGLAGQPVFGQSHGVIGLGDVPVLLSEIRNELG